MSTRCQVRIIANGYALNLYHHCDGYFDGVGKELHDMLHTSNNDIHDFIKEILNDGAYEVTFFIHGDIEYFYLLDFDKKEFKGWHLIWDKNTFSPWNLKNDDKEWYLKMPNIDKNNEVDILSL